VDLQTGIWRRIQCDEGEVDPIFRQGLRESSAPKMVPLFTGVGPIQPITAGHSFPIIYYLPKGAGRLCRRPSGEGFFRGDDLLRGRPAQRPDYYSGSGRGSEGLKQLEGQFLKHLDLLKRGGLNEPEFGRANEAVRSQASALEGRREELRTWVDLQRHKVSVAEQMPAAIRTYVEDFQGMEGRQQKAQLQTILKAAYVYRDGRIELEFRT
jgi:hypothetical protein